MKKFILSSIVIIAFLSYSFYRKIFAPQAQSVITPKNSALPSSAFISRPTGTPPSASAPADSVSAPSGSPAPSAKPQSLYKDGSFTGDAADAFYGLIQVKAIITAGRISDIQFLQYPNEHRTSIEINSQADPLLAQEAIQVQSAKVDIISGATDSSRAFIQSMQSALDKAKN